jgi:hypothetical protein
MGATGNQYPPTSFHNEARQRIIRTGVINYDGGARQPIQLPSGLLPTGFLNRIMVTQRINTIYGTAGPTAQDAFAPYAGGIDRIEVLPSTLGPIFSTSGEMAAVIDAIDNQYNFGNASVTPAYGYANNAAPGVAANTDVKPFHVPVGLNLQNWPSPIGLYQLAAYLQSVQLRVYFRPVNAVANQPGTGMYVPGGTSVLGATTGTAEIHQEYFETFANPNGLPDLRFIHRWREIPAINFSADGDVEIPILQENQVCRIIYWVVNNGVPTSAVVTQLRLEYGGNTDPRSERIDEVLHRMNMYYGNMVLPPGVLTHDFLAETHTDRDLMNTLAVTRPRAYLTIAGGTYGANPSYIKVAFEEICPLRGGNP